MFVIVVVHMHRLQLAEYMHRALLAIYGTAYNEEAFKSSSKSSTAPTFDFLLSRYLYTMHKQWRKVIFNHLSLFYVIR